MAPCGGLARQQGHAAYRAVTRLIAHHLGVHRAGVLHTHLQRRGREVLHLRAKGPGGDGAAQVGQPGFQSVGRQCRGRVGCRQRRDIVRAQRQDRPRARHLGIGHRGGIAQTGMQRANDNQDIGMTRRAGDAQMRPGQIQPHRTGNGDPGQHEGAQVAGHCRGDHPPDSGHRARTRTRDHHCRLNAPWLQPYSRPRNRMARKTPMSSRAINPSSR